MNRRTIMGKFSCLIIGAFVAAMIFFFIIYNISNLIIGEKCSRETDAMIVSDLETYVRKFQLEPEDRKKLWMWCRSRDVDIELFVEGHLVFSSIFDANEKKYNMEESEEEKERAVCIRFGDTDADVVFYPYYHLYDETMLIEITAAVLLFFAIIVVGTRREMEYIHLINEEIQVLEGGDLTREITIKGDDEITMLAESVNEFRKSMQNQLRTIEQLEKNNRLTLAEIAHDLRTPLTALIMYLDFAQNEIEGREPAAEAYLAKAREKSVRLKNLLDQNYNYTTMQDFFLAEKQEEKAYEALSAYISDITTGLEREGFTVRSDISCGHSRILVQRDAVSRVFGNLMTNINKYANREYGIQICCRDSERYVEVEVVNKVRQFDGDKPESTGFGSRICKRLMGEMKGDYTAEEADGTFRTTLRFLKV